MVGNRRSPRPAVFALETVLVAACYFAAGRLGLLRQLAVQDAVVTPIWPPAGVAVAFLFIFGLRAVPGITLGALFVVMSLAPLRITVLGTLFGNTAGPVCAYLLLRRVGFRTDLSRLRDGVALVFLGALASMLISASVGVGLLVLTGKLAGDSFWPVWLAWWVGDAMGVVIVTPLLLLLRRMRWPPRGPGWKWAEATGMALVACLVIPVASLSTVSMLFLIYPLLIWAALRFQLAGSLLCALAASVTTTVVATEGPATSAG